MEWSLFGTIVLQVLIVAVVLVVLILLGGLAVTGLRAGLRSDGTRRQRDNADRR